MFDNDEAARIAGAILLFRRDRDSMFPKGIFSEPAWVCLLELFVADAKGQPITTREIASRNEISTGNAMRWVRHLQSIALIASPPAIGLDDQLTLTPDGLERMELLVRQARLSGQMIDERRKL